MMWSRLARLFAFAAMGLLAAPLSMTRFLGVLACLVLVDMVALMELSS